MLKTTRRRHGFTAASNSNNMTNAVPSRGPWPSAAPKPAAATAQRMVQLQQILTRFEVSIAEAQDLVVLEDYEIVLILDDSRSMRLSSVPTGDRRSAPSRWDELRESASLLIELACCFDRSGVDVFFLNRGLIDGVKGSRDPRLVKAFNDGVRAGTPLTESLQTVADHCKGERPILLMIFTDGEPNGGVRNFERELKRLVTKKSTTATIKVQIMACTADEDSVGYLNDIDERFRAVDVTDDYYSEMLEVTKKARTKKQFTRGDWLMKAMLGPISNKFDAWDETGKKQAHRKYCDDSDCSDSDHEIGCHNDNCVLA